MTQGRSPRLELVYMNMKVDTTILGVNYRVESASPIMVLFGALVSQRQQRFFEKLKTVQNCLPNLYHIQLILFGSRTANPTSHGLYLSKGWCVHENNPKDLPSQSHPLCVAYPTESNRLFFGYVFSHPWK